MNLSECVLWTAKCFSWTDFSIDNAVSIIFKRWVNEVFPNWCYCHGFYFSFSPFLRKNQPLRTSNPPPTQSHISPFIFYHQLPHIASTLRKPLHEKFWAREKFQKETEWELVLNHIDLAAFLWSHFVAEPNFNLSIFSGLRRKTYSSRMNLFLTFFQP